MNFILASSGDVSAYRKKTNIFVGKYVDKYKDNKFLFVERLIIHVWLLWAIFSRKFTKGTTIETKRVA